MLPPISLLLLLLPILLTYFIYILLKIHPHSIRELNGMAMAAIIKEREREREEQIEVIALLWDIQEVDEMLYALH